MIVLLWVFLLSFVVIKLFFGEWFVTVVENEKILIMGQFIDEHKVVKLLVDTLVSILAMHFYLCSCKQLWRLKVSWYLSISAYILAINVGYLWNSSIILVVDLLGLIIFPILLKADIKQTIVVFLLHELGQPILLFIRSEPLYLASTNYATQFFLLFDVYVWLALYYLYSNMYKEETLWERLLFRFSVIRRKRNSKKNS
jgi:hypothetical protein